MQQNTKVEDPWIFFQPKFPPPKSLKRTIHLCQSVKWHLIKNQFYKIILKILMVDHFVEKVFFKPNWPNLTHNHPSVCSFIPLRFRGLKVHRYYAQMA